MKGLECVDIELDTGRRGDEHYRDFGVWIRSRLNPDFIETARDSALAYQAALLLLVECPTAHESTPRIDRKIEVIVALHALIAKDLDMISTYNNGIDV